MTELIDMVAMLNMRLPFHTSVLGRATNMQTFLIFVTVFSDLAQRTIELIIDLIIHGDNMFHLSRVYNIESS